MNLEQIVKDIDNVSAALSRLKSSVMEEVAAEQEKKAELAEAMGFKPIKLEVDPEGPINLIDLDKLHQLDIRRSTQADMHYIRSNPKVGLMIQEGNFSSPYDHWLKVGKAQGLIYGLKSTQESDYLFHLLCTNHWPPAVNPSLICESFSDLEKMQRAEGILSGLVEKDLSGLSFLDYGCGEGHVAWTASSKGAAKVLGYDIEKQWKDQPFLTTSFEDVQNSGPYDVILLYDVLDHCMDEHPIEVLKKVKPLCHEKTEVFIRCHPWASRHGGHLYRRLNKAFVHVIFSEQELASIGLKCNVRKIINPETYRTWLLEAGFTYKESIQSESVDNLFLSGLIKRRLVLQNATTSQLKNSFVDYRAIVS